jgi:MFS family permease
LFGFAESFEVLVGARFVQGIGGALAWTAGISWIAADAGPERRGEAIGRVVAAAVAGLILGPAIGALASEIGIGVTFAAVAAIGAMVALWSTLVPAPTSVGTKLREILGPGRAPLWFAVWLVTLPAILAGCLEVVIPLELDEFGASALVIGAIFTGSAAVEAVFAPLIGRLSDKRGRLVPLRLGLIATTLLVFALAFATSVPTVAIGVTLVFAALQLFWTPGMALVADICDRLGLDQGITGALTNLAWAGGAAIGSLAAGGLAEAAGRPVAYGLLVLLCALSATAFFLGRSWAGDDLVSGG